MRGLFRFGMVGMVGALCASACGKNSATPDAAPGPVPDAPPDAAGDAAPLPDAPLLPDAAPDAPPTPPGVDRWVVDSQRLPSTNAQAQALGLDLNGDAIADNQLGAVLAAFVSQGFAIQPAADAAIARGAILMLGEATVGTGGSTAATFTMYTGANPRPAPCSGPADTVCRRHLQGTGTFDVAATSAHDPPLAGTLAGDVLTAGPGQLQVAMAFPNAAPIVLDLIGARVRLQMPTAGSLGPSVIAGAITLTQVDLKIYPALQQSVSAVVQTDCPGTVPPGCGCVTGSTGATLLNLFDIAPKDCAITVDEIRNNTLIKSLFAPDVTIGGQQALSFGFGATAIQGAFTP